VRYYKQFHKWTPLYVSVLSLGVVCLCLAYSETVLDSRITFLTCGIVCLISGWAVRKGGTHYIEIDDEKIIHRGFRNWTIRKSEVTRIERGRKGWIDNNELYLSVYASEEKFDIEDGFLTNEENVQELTKAIGSRRS
jgi:hypothetical protein